MNKNCAIAQPLNGPTVSTIKVVGTARKRYAAGRRITVPQQVRTVRDLIRKHLRDAGVDQVSLAVPWNCKPGTVRALMCKATQRRALSSQYIDAVVEFLHLDDFDATELYRQAAREAGFKIDGPTLKGVK